MKTRYSKTTGAFYPFDIGYAGLPADVQEVAVADYEKAMSRPAGAAFSFDANGVLTITPAPAPTLAAVIADALRKIDADVDAIYGDVIGNRQAEYDRAESEAQAYKDAAYPTTPVPATVQSYADAKTWTAKAAADDILATAAKWRTVQADIRAKRLARKEAVRAATDVAGVETALGNWRAYVDLTRTALNV